MSVRYENRLNEISKARNKSKTSSIVKGIKWTQSQLSKMRIIVEKVVGDRRKSESALINDLKMKHY
jgi:hypothetical protein